VIFSKTYKLGPRLEAGAASIQSNYAAQRTTKLWIPYRKTYAYDAAQYYQPLLLIYADNPMRQPGQAHVAAALELNGHLETYFRDI